MRYKMLTSRLGAWFNNIPIQDPIDRQMASLVQTMLLGFMSVVALSGVINLLIAEEIPWQAILLRSFIFILIIAIPLTLLRRGYFRGSVILIIAFLLTLETLVVLSTNLRSIAETLAFFTLAILLAGSLLSRRALVITFLVSAISVVLGAFQESDLRLRQDSIVIGTNYILLNSLIGLLLDRFGAALRATLHAALQRGDDLQKEIHIRKQAEDALQSSTDQLEILLEIDRALLAARSVREIADDALVRIRRLIPCLRASLTLFDLDKREAKFLAAKFHEPVKFPETPIPFEEFGQRIIDKLQQNEPWMVDNVMEDPQATELDKRLAEQSGVHAWLCLPILDQGQLIGSLNLGRGIGELFHANEAAIAHDVANQLAIALRQTNLYNALQTELIQRQKLISQLEANNAELERFTYTVSHDLRSPLVTIKGFVGMLRADLANDRHEKVRDDMQRISNAADKMDALLSELLELSRIGRIINPPEAVDLSRLANEAIEMLDARLRSGKVRVDISPELPVIYGDRVRLREVFENLIDNAAKYMGDQEHPLIEIGCRDGKEKAIFIKDNGMGIEPSYLKKIFGLFEKLNPTSEGAGIGLALIKRIIEVHGGRIWAESEGVGKGSTFFFTIPDGR